MKSKKISLAIYKSADGTESVFPATYWMNNNRDYEMMTEVVTVEFVPLSDSAAKARREKLNGKAGIL
jgi:hypothetical protein